jgi:DNA-binding GntR family transcriptional regulator
MIETRPNSERLTTDQEDPDAEAIYLEIRLRILHAQFLPDQVIDRALVITHFQANSGAADRALDSLTREGYLRTNVRGSFTIRRFEPDDVLATFEIMRRMTLVGARSLIRQPDQATLSALEALIDWSPGDEDFDDGTLEEFVYRTRSVLRLLMRRISANGQFTPMRLFGSPALNRYTLHAMKSDDVRRAWDQLCRVSQAILDSDHDRLAFLLGQERPYELAVADLLSRVNSLSSGPSVTFNSLPPEFHALIGDDERYPYFGLGLRERSLA